MIEQLVVVCFPGEAWAMPSLQELTPLHPEDRTCANCGEQVRPITKEDGLDLTSYGHYWNHQSGIPHCDNGWYDLKNDEWHDPTYATIGGDGWG